MLVGVIHDMKILLINAKDPEGSATLVSCPIGCLTEMAPNVANLILRIPNKCSALKS